MVLAKMASLLTLCILIRIVYSSSQADGGIMEIHYPDLILETELDGDINLGAGSGGSVHISPGMGGTVMYGSLDLLEFVRIVRSFPPVWGTPSAVGFFGKYDGGDFVNVTLNAKDPEGGELIYTVVAGDLPPGIILDPRKGVIRGFAPDENALYVVTIRAFDNQHKHADAIFRFETRDTDRCLLRAPCKNDGVCVDMNGLYQCHCAGIFGGRDCEQECNETTLGVDANSQFIPDAQMSAYLSLNQSLASDGRLNGRGWCGREAYSWLQVDLGGTRYVHRVVMQGPYASNYAMQYSVDGQSFTYHTNTSTSKSVIVSIPGGNGLADYMLPEVIEARFLRFQAVSFQVGFYPCLKVDIFGCRVFF
ncbi:uncharacterized protein [Haliotis cracherodii]|uniref:uncharacterized protein n=1 Tax=Haliotis cracherodii TaxID=6455 RepID=UPI0039E76CB8